jgi:hypothetical protein
MKRRRTPTVETVRVNAVLDDISPHEKLQPKDINRSLFFLVRDISYKYVYMAESGSRLEFPISDPKLMSTTKSSEVLMVTF